MEIKDILQEAVSNPDSLNAESLIQISEVYKPEIYKIANYIFGMYKDLVANEEFYKVQAKDKANYRDALLAEGFAREEVMQLLINRNTELKNNIKKNVRTTKNNQS